MDKFIKKEDMFVILDNAPANVDKSKLIDKYISEGFKIEGINDQPEPPKSMTGSEKAPFQATGQEGIAGGTLKAVGNTPSSAIELTKNVVSAVAHPIKTGKAVIGLAKGVGAKLGEVAFENTDIGQNMLEKINQTRISKGMPELNKDENGKFQVNETEDLKAINQVGNFIKDRYGSVDKFKETAIEDPVGVLSDLAVVFSGGGTAVTKLGNVSKIAEISNLGNKISKVSTAIEPINAVTKTVGEVKNFVGNSTAGKVVSDIIPTVSDMQRNQVVKALDLTQGDLASIGKKTGNDVTDFIVSKNLLKETPEAVADSLNEFRKTTKDTKATEIKKVSSIYTPKQIPSVIKGLDTIFEDVKGVAGLEDIASEIKALRNKKRNKKQFTLEDIQNAQYLLDDNSSIYSKLGDAKSSTKAKGLDNIRKDIRSFIENEVDTATDGQTNIKQLNNDIQTSYAIEDAINTRATRNLTRQKLSLGDSVVLFGGGATFNPAIGVGLYLGKKIIETPTFRLAFTKVLNQKPIAKVSKLIEEVKTKNVSPETQKFINEIAKEARSKSAIIGSSANALDKSKSEK